MKTQIGESDNYYSLSKAVIMLSKVFFIHHIHHNVKARAGRTWTDGCPVLWKKGNQKQRKPLRCTFEKQHKGFRNMPNDHSYAITKCCDVLSHVISLPHNAYWLWLVDTGTITPYLDKAATTEVAAVQPVQPVNRELEQWLEQGKRQNSAFCLVPSWIWSQEK